MAKLRADQLDSALRKQLAPVYLVSGDEPLLVQEACDTIREAARRAGFTERERHHVEAGFDWEELLTSANSLSLFADKKILELRIDNGKPGDKGGKALLSYCEQPSEDNLLLIVTPKLDGSAQRSKWFKAVEKTGAFVQIWPIAAPQLPRWIDQRMQQAGLRADRDAIDMLAARVEGNLLAATQEIEKLKLLANDDGLVSTETVAGAVADSARYDVFNLIDKALHGDARSAIKTLQGLRGEGTDATVVLWALAREIRTLSQMAHALQQGNSMDRAAKSAGVWDKRKPLVNNALRRLKQPQLQMLLRKANGVDKAIKGLRNADAWDELMDLTLNLSGVFSLSPAVQRLSLL
ncbi:DNA polymerase III subunit delta [Pseudomaricurvus alkylphenolicus]|uniref:DNA polymerase III subunit delta n=1 Tax=Pseudomaricurvus alkylphenolicus TaxID=1306991 RepID=UPI00142288A5|nr:DNA polymerase III subunit delta [Pseudomaricurvus alkylphenolicus]NIB40132.1 DNA polymerase III subunit delta [Pseudomaricurvus alkylphenolicus]